MKKIPTLFKRDFANDPSRVLNEVNPRCEWVLAGEGVATQKLDGTCCLVRSGRLYKRREVKPGQLSPPDFELIEIDDETGKSVGWVPVSPDDPTDKWHRMAFAGYEADGTYELIGPHIQGNPEGAPTEFLKRHDESTVFLSAPRDFSGLREWLEGRDIEGLVFHHPDGRMAKIKLKDFGLRRNKGAREI